MSFSQQGIMNIIPKFNVKGKIATLQVRIQPPWKPKTSGIPDGKKTSLYSSFRASMTMEAALVLPLLIFATVCLMLPMKILNTERKLQAALEALGEDFSKYAYLQRAIEDQDIKAVAGAGDFAKGFCRYLAPGVAVGYGHSRIMDVVDTKSIRSVSMAGSQVLEDGETILFTLNYEIQMPFPVLGLSSLKRTICCRRRAWIGKPGQDWDDSGGENGMEEDEFVYLGKNSTRYHNRRTCHYLFNDLRAVSKEEAKSLRNSSGGKYYACRICGAGVGAQVYIMPSGSSYHSKRDCTAILAYVRKAKKSEVEHLGPCSYCSK